MCLLWPPAHANATIKARADIERGHVRSLHMPDIERGYVRLLHMHLALAGNPLR
jgi:hypothetical protein